MKIDMNELLMLVGIILIGIAVAFAFGYFIFRVTSYYKSNYGLSMGPSVVAICLSMDLSVVVAMLYGNNDNENYILVFSIIATVLFVYGIYRDINNYHKASIGAIAFQVLIAVLQIFIVMSAIITIIFRKVVKKRKGQLNTVLNWTKFIWNM